MKPIFLTVWIMGLAIVVGLAVVPDLVTLQPGADKMLHLMIFCALMVLPAMIWDSARAVIFSAITLFCAGLGMEFFQSLTPYRNAEMMDVVYNSAGLLCGGLIGYLLRDAYRALKPLAEARAQFRLYSRARG